MGEGELWEVQDVQHHPGVGSSLHHKHRTQVPSSYSPRRELETCWDHLAEENIGTGQRQLHLVSLDLGMSVERKKWILIDGDHQRTK